MWFSYRSDPGVFIPVPVKKVHEIIEANSRGEVPEDISLLAKIIEKTSFVEHNFENVVGQDSLTRFDKKGGRQKNNPKSKKNFGRTQTGAAQKPQAPAVTQGSTQPKPEGQNRPKNHNKPKPNPNNSSQNKGQNNPTQDKTNLPPRQNHQRNHNKPIDRNQSRQPNKPNRPGNDNKNSPPNP
jgi:hypothetical protein